MSERTCTCAVAEPRHHGTVITGGSSGYAVYLDYTEDTTEFDPTCPFHGDGGSMVACLRASTAVPAVGDKPKGSG